jgi:large subunit ribosomal protein L32
MAVPKKKVSKQRKRLRSANWKIKAPTLVDCRQCHEKTIPHRVCKKCGYYDGKQVVIKKEKSSSDE